LKNNKDLVSIKKNEIKVTTINEKKVVTVNQKETISKSKNKIQVKFADKSKLTLENKATAKTVSKRNESDSEKDTGEEAKFHNSIGLKVKEDLFLNEFPFKIERCDQLVMFKTKYIYDMGDYRFRKEGFFTISAYYLNQFLDKDATKLDESILLTESKGIARHLKGARGCIFVDGGRHRNDIAMCFENKAESQNILGVLHAFTRCRMGDDLKPLSAALIRKLIQMCLKRKRMLLLNKNKPKSTNKKKKKLSGSNKWAEDRKKYFHPLKLRVPGTR